MPEEKVVTSAEETTTETAVGGGENADTTNASAELNEAEFKDGAETKETKPVEENKQDNSANARRRREAERQKEISEARTQAVIDTLGGKNPFTDEEMTDAEDVEEYLLMKEIEKKGGDPVNDFNKARKEKVREKAAADAKAKAQTEWYTNDKEDFAKKYPDIDIEKLINNKSFQKYATGKVGNVPLAEIFSDYNDMLAEIDESAKEKAQRLYANKVSSVGSLSTPNKSEPKFFSREQVQKMSSEQRRANYDVIRESMTKW